MRKPSDLPYYNDIPVGVSGWGWFTVLLATGMGFAALLAPIPELAVFPLNYLPALLFAGLPLAAMAIVSRGHVGALFDGYGLRRFTQSLGFAVLTLLAPSATALALSPFVTFSANPTSDLLAQADGAALAIFLSRTFVQLLGEEVVTILPLLAVLWFCVHMLKLSRSAGLIIAVVVSTVWFVAMHLETYNWNIVQCLAVIGSARLVLTASYLITRNLWVSFGAHLINDWSIFLFVFAGTHVPIGT